MQHFLSLDGDSLARLRADVFPKIKSGETILFLGAGASVTQEKRYLSSDIMDYYSDAKGINLETDDIIDFVDTLSANRTFDRNEFDDYVADLLKKYTVTETHRIIASIHWKEIITTNFDLLLEAAFDEVAGTTREGLRPKDIHLLSEYSYRPANDEVKYVKLNGCLHDKRRYPFVFSSDDFGKTRKFYREVLRSLENLSPKIQFLSVGYSYKDLFAKQLLERFDSFNFRNRRWLLNVDPFVEDARLDFFSSQQICVIRANARDFFTAYQEWEDAVIGGTLARDSVVVRGTSKEKLVLQPRVKLRLYGNIIQLDPEGSFKPMPPADFYAGEQPNFGVIRENLDVVKDRSLSKVVSRVKEVLEGQGTVIPTLVLEGSFGTGKSTLSYRAIAELLKNSDLRLIAFEVFDADALNTADLAEIFAKSNAAAIILFFNGVELDSAFKALTRLRNRLSVEQFADFKVIFLASMRENILAEFLREHEYKNFHQLNVDQIFTESEAADLVEKLRGAGLLEYRDAKEKSLYVEKVLREYEGDTLVSLISLVAGGSHSEIIRSAYLGLNDSAKKVFLFTSLLYKFGIPMPASLLRRLIDISWEDFARDIIPYNFKNFIIRVEAGSPGTDPDLFFQTRHPLISQKLVEMFLPTEDARFERYEYLLRRLTESHFSAELAVDLLKTLRHNEDLSEEKVNRLFDVCAQQFHEDPQFNLHYAINLQHRRDEQSLKKGLERITYAESFLENRSHRLVHRKGVINFHLARISFDQESDRLNETYKYADRAEDFFEVKVILDPFSSYSYKDYLTFQIWQLERFPYDQLSELRKRVKIEELFDQAEKYVSDDLTSITRLRARYLEGLSSEGPKSKDEYRKYLEGLLADPEQRPYGLILSYYNEQRDESKLHEIVKELEGFQYLDDAANILFRHFGRRLHVLSNRLRFTEIIRKHPFLERKDMARYYYYSFINEAYNRHFDSGSDFLNVLRTKIGYLNPEIREFWRDEDTGRPKIFDGYVIVKGGKWKKVQVPDLHRFFDLKGSNLSRVVEGANVRVKLSFLLNGIKAEIVELSK